MFNAQPSDVVSSRQSVEVEDYLTEPGNRPAPCPLYTGGDATSTGKL